jgi:hypothetical protein
MAIFLAKVFESIMTLIGLLMLANSAIDPVSGPSCTSWLLGQLADYQKLHIPVPYEQIPPIMQPHLPFPTPEQFSDPIMIKVYIEFSWRQVML